MTVATPKTETNKNSQAEVNTLTAANRPAKPIQKATRSLGLDPK